MSIDKTLEERGSRYGEFINHAIITQSLKGIIYSALTQQQKQLPPDMNEALDMICHKIGRIVNGDPTYVDSWVDIAGYAQLVVNRLQKQDKPNTPNTPQLTIVK